MYTIDTTSHTVPRPSNRADDIVAELLPIYMEQGKEACLQRYNAIVSSLETFNKKGRQTGGISAMEGNVIRNRLRQAILDNGGTI